MFYHVIINAKKKSSKDSRKVYSELDIKDKDNLIKSIVIPYIQNEKFMVDGAFLTQENIDTLKIYSTDIVSDVLHQQKEREREYRNRNSHALLWTTASKSDDIRWNANEITRHIFTEADTFIKNQESHISIESTIPSLDNKKIFIVHGHDDGMKNTVARFLERLGFEAIILHEQENKGQTIIEKFERSSDVGFAVILYTPCDMGGKNGDSEQRPRARQNVVLEHGYFIGKLGRERVLALHRDKVELPSDLQGILYTPFDSNDSWMFTLAKEMKVVGYNIDMNKVIKV